jgi:hypothetical protein
MSERTASTMVTHLLETPESWVRCSSRGRDRAFV